MFNRWKSKLDRSLAYINFIKHHTEVNDLYWSFVPVAHYAMYLERHKSPGQTTNNLFCASGPDVRRLALEASTWKSHFKQLQNWVRLNCVMALSSYFEVYLKTMIVLSIKSDPGVIYKKSKAIDGVCWLKVGILEHGAKEVENCVHRSWPSRVKQYKELFGYVPKELDDSIGVLDTIRKFRNSVGHSFGRDINDYSYLLNIERKKMMSCSEKRLKEWLGVIEKVAKSINDHLLSAHIGEFELIYFYHNWRELNKFDSQQQYLKLKADIRRQLSYPSPSKQFCKDMISYYSAV